MYHRSFGEKGAGMPDHEELEFRTADFLDRQDTERRKARLMPWGRHLEPTPETDAEEDETDEAERS